MLHAIHSHLHQQIFTADTAPYGFLGLDISTVQQQLKVGGGGSASLHYCLPLNVALFFLLLHFTSI
jgi:hypothetical protein